MLTRVVIAYGLESFHLDVVATSFLALSHDVRRLLVETRKAVLHDERSSSTLDAARQSSAESVERFRAVITSDVTCQEGTPVYRRLIASLIELEASLRQVLASQGSQDTPAMQS